MKNKCLLTYFGSLAVAAMMLLSCEKPIIDSTADVAKSETANLCLRISSFDIMPYGMTRAEGVLDDYCTRLNVAVYQNGSRVKAVNQQAGSSGFGSVDMCLAAGSYQVLVLGHSANGNPVLTTPQKVQFTNDDGFTDTFYDFQTVTVGESQQTREIVLQRVTAMFRFVTTDAVPANVSRLRFYYTGGSGALDATTGFGCVNSKQTVDFTVTPDMVGKPLQLEVYTIPKARTGKLKMTVTAFAQDGTVVCEQEFADVPVEQNKITQYTGQFFTTAVDDGGHDNGADESRKAFYVEVNPEWDALLEYTF